MTFQWQDFMICHYKIDHISLRSKEIWILSRLF